MRFNEDLISIHAYLCADGYVIKNPETQKNKYYRIGLRNINLILLKDFQNKFQNYFKIKPRLVEGERCEIGSKEIYSKLIEKFGSFYSYHWTVPFLNKQLSKVWLRAFFDCEGWVFCKTHQNRHIGLDSVNSNGIIKIIELLNNLGINTIRKFNKKRNIHRIFIYGKNNLIRFKKEIGFLHPEKLEKLNKAIEDYVEYLWSFPSKKSDLKMFIDSLLKEKIRIRKPYYIRIISKEKENLKKLKEYLEEFYNVFSLLYKRKNGIGTIYYELNINKRSEVQKLICLKLIPNIFKLKNH